MLMKYKVPLIICLSLSDRLVVLKFIIPYCDLALLSSDPDRVK
jgi:hypothetical protein